MGQTTTSTASGSTTMRTLTRPKWSGPATWAKTATRCCCSISAIERSGSWSPINRRPTIPCRNCYPTPTDRPASSAKGDRIASRDQVGQQMVDPSTSAKWFTATRLRTHGLILALCLWSVYVWNMTTPGLIDRAGNLKGTDFLYFYTVGSLALTHRGSDLYNMTEQSKLAAERVPAAAGIHYLPLYPPQVSIFFAPFARLPYPCALILWLFVSSLIYGGCCHSLWRACPNLRNHKLTVVILALAFPAFWNLIAWGQTSALALACFTVAFFALRAQRGLPAGLALGCLIFKPQLALAAALVFVVTLNWKVIAGALLSATMELAAAWLYYGSAPIRDWMHTLLNLPNVLPQLEP